MLSSNPLLEWSTAEVFRFHEAFGFPLHDAYHSFGSTRVSCKLCILASQHDLLAASTCATNEAIYREMVALEVCSTFSFQQRQWLADVAPHLLDNATRASVQEAKRRATRREAEEARLPAHLLYSKGWPTVLPSPEEARLLAEVRGHMAEIMEWSLSSTDPDTIRQRYADLMAQKAHKDGTDQLIEVNTCSEHWTDHGVHVPQIVADGIVQPLLYEQEVQV